MNLKYLTDQQLRWDTRKLVESERALLTQVLFHLKEIESRKLYSDFGYGSLFEYSCKELKYSSDQAVRRIQAMRLLKEIPEVAQKIDSGELSLSNINQAQKHFRHSNIKTKTEKVQLLKSLCNKSVRDGQKEILKIASPTALPPETKKQVTSTHVYVSFNMSEQFEKKLDEVRTLLGPKSFNLTLAELFEHLADLSIQRLTEKKFGKKTVSNSNKFLSLPETGSILNNQSKKSQTKSTLNVQGRNSNANPNQIVQSKKSEENPTLIVQGETYISSPTLNVQGETYKSSPTLNVQGERIQANAVSIGRGEKCKGSQIKESHQPSAFMGPQDPKLNCKVENPQNRYLSQKIKYRIWQKHGHRCAKCDSAYNLQIDHIKPLALGGSNMDENLRLLCFNCNQRSRIEARL